MFRITDYNKGKGDEKGMSYQFEFDQRLGISLPVLDKEWNQYTTKEQTQILYEWEDHRSDIPARIKQIEKIIEQKLHELNNEDNFVRSCELNSEISQLASAINDLNIWFRIQEETNTKIHN
jgi:hypothetical protein